MVSSNLDFPGSEGLWDIPREVSWRDLDVRIWTTVE